MSVSPENPSVRDPELQARLNNLHEQAQREATLRERIMRERRVLIPLLALALLGFLNFGTARVLGKSMEPRYHTGDMLYLLKTFRLLSPLKAGDIIVVHFNRGKSNTDEVVKRVVFIQNAKSDAPWPKTITNSRGTYPAEAFFPNEVAGRKIVPSGAVMVLGDNIQNSMDSRDYGPVLDSEIVGKVMNP